MNTSGARVCFFLILSLLTSPLLAGEIAPPQLKDFAEALIEGNRKLIAAEHDLESAGFEKSRALSVFSPVFSYSSNSSKSANRSFNPISGIEEDYSTKRNGMTAGISQRTPIGRMSYDYSQDKTDYTNTQSSYFSSLYLGWQTGLLRRENRLIELESRMAHQSYNVSRAQTDAIMLDILIGAFQTLFSRVVAEQNKALKADNLQFYATLVEEAEIKLHNGMGSELDLKQSSLRYQQAETSLDETMLTLREADRKLEMQFGETAWNPQLASFSLNPVLADIPASFDEQKMIELAFARRPDYRVFEHQFQIQKASYLKAREQAKPDLTARARWGKQGRGFDLSAAERIPDKNWDVTLAYTFSFGPEDEKLGFSSQREKLKAFAARLEQKRDEVKTAVVDALLEFYRKNLESQRASKKLSSEVLEGQRLNFQLGKISLLDLTRYQQDFDNASLSVVQSETRLLLEWLRLLYETGTLAQYLGISEKDSAGLVFIAPLEAPLEDAEDAEND